MATVKIYAEGSDTALVILSVGDDTRVDLSDHIGELELDSSYEWEVTVTAANNTKASSGRKSFQYVSIFTEGNLNWPDGPDPYEYIGTRRYFSEIQANAIEILQDYVVDSMEEQKMMNAAESLFSGNVVPSRTDFVSIENILGLIASKENSYKDEVDELIEDGLGAADIHKIYQFFDRLTKIPPLAPSNVSLSFSGLNPLEIISGSVHNSGESDLTVDISWTPSSLEKGVCTIQVNDELSEDISYYTFELVTGFTDVSCSHILYYRLEDIKNMNRGIDIAMDHINFEHLSSSKQTRYEIRATATDQRQGVSGRHSRLYNVAHVPVGVLRYQLRATQKDLLDKKTIRPYYDIYNGTAKAYIHRVTGNVDGVYHYAVKVHDKNGDESPWYYIPDQVKIDPLKPPAAPKPRVKSVTTNSITFTWDYVKTADKYEVDPLYGSSSNSVLTTNEKTFSGLNENTSYSVRVRATNRAGSSAWVTVSGKTKAKPIVTYTQKNIKSRTWRTGYYIHYSSGRVVRPSAQYRYEMDNEEVIHGEWIELRQNWYRETGYVQKGTKWGNHKSLYFLDYNGWKSRLAGKEIIDVQFYIKRLNTQHGYPDDGRFLHVWSHNYASASSLPSASVGPSLTNHYMVEKLDWDRGEGHWVTLPKSFGEKLRDGKIKGIAFFHPTADRSPYSYMRFDANTIQFKIRYK